MNHDNDNIDATIKELDEQVESIISEMTRNADVAGYRGGIEKVNPERLNRGMEARARNEELKPKLIEALNALACAYQQKGDERTAKYYFDQAKRY